MSQSVRTRQRQRQTMSEFMWILLCVIFLQLKEIHGDIINVFVKKEKDATLPCMNVISGQRGCETVTWTFKPTVRESTVELIKDGKVKESVLTQSHRLNITADCSLLINKVNPSNIGHYYCKQSDESKEHNDDAEFHLSLVIISEENDRKVKFICSVHARKKCEHTVKWLYDGKAMNIKVSKLSYICSATVTLDNKPMNYELLECEVTDAVSKKVHRFPFKSAVQKTGEDETKPTVAAPTKTAGFPLWAKIVVPFVAFAVLLVIVVAFIKWKRNKGSQTQMDENTADPEDGVSYASVYFTKNKKTTSNHLHQHNDDNTVTYSTVRASPSSAAASTDPSILYATVNKPKN
ncbi:uncharacterized protein LOC115415369 isoform X1 [Sphaeramia orbicularis]|uniref:uncharacterized protein LOC115415369 isoform X1 n=1 Tax=Sphaeramia orbicularis TaxID=375764 RepID=UPI0011814F6F|nr:uncharacterized protein LOC115415369 isoform X1 [Sphaeramia orbicularis]